MRYVVTVPAPTPDTPVLPGVLYAVWLNGDRSRGSYRRVYQAGGRTFDEVLEIGPDGLESSHCVEFSGDDLQRLLAQLHAHLVWVQSGERVGPYADEPLDDLDGLPPQVFSL
jgi:hypothetical protein